MQLNPLIQKPPYRHMLLSYHIIC